MNPYRQIPNAAMRASCMWPHIHSATHSLRLSFPAPVSHFILSPCLKLHHPVHVISISAPIATNTGEHTSSSSPCKALCVHTLCTVSDHPSSAGPSSYSRHTDIELWVQPCPLSRRGRPNRWCRTVGLSAGHTVRGTWWSVCGERLRRVDGVWGEKRC